MDIYTPEKRSKIMSSIRAQNTKPERIVRKWLFAHGFRFRKNNVNLPGRPDIVLPKYKAVIFVNGCFWHGHKDCKHSLLPKTKTEWWNKKILRTVERDKENHETLIKLGWNVFVIWQCELKRDFEQRMNILIEKVKR